MALNTPIKSELFSFLSVRSPKHYPAQQQINAYVNHPNLAKSSFSGCFKRKGDREKFESVTVELKNDSAFTSYKQVEQINTALYNLSATTNCEEIQRLSEDEELYLWDQLFYQAIVRDSPYVRQAISTMLIHNHRLDLPRAERFTIKTLVVLPLEFVHCLTHYLYPKCEKSMIGVNNLGVLEYRKIEQTVCCYLPGEVSHIENIMAREYKEKQTRNLVRSEFGTESSEETEIENLTDVTTATRNELSTEVSKVLSEERSNNFGGSLSVKGKIFKREIELNTYADFANSNSSTQSNNTAREYAKEVTERALERIVTKTSSKRTSKIIKEFEEQHKHGFDNRAGGSNVTGVYRWLDIVYKNQLVSYGKKLLIEFAVPEPADFYNRAVKYVPPKKVEVEPVEKPQSPKDFGVCLVDDLTNEKITELSSHYCVPKPSFPENKTECKTYEASMEKSSTPYPHPISILFDSDFEATGFTIDYTFEWKSGKWSTKSYLKYNIGNVTGMSDEMQTNGIGNWNSESDNGSGSFLNPIQNPIEATITVVKCRYFEAEICVDLTYRSELKKDKLQKFLDDINQVYQDQLTDYQNWLDEQKQEEAFLVEKEEQFSSNPSQNRILEQRELKRACIELLSEPFCKPQGVNYICHDPCNNNKQDNSCPRDYDSDDFKISSIKRNQSLNEYTKQVKFFEGAFMWDAMSYIFYPYYWADKCNWVNLFNTKDTDPIFEGFKQAGMAKVVVPVHNEFAEALALYIETGDIYLGGDIIPEDESDSCNSVFCDLANVGPHEIGEPFETRVPTSLAIIQGKSAYLDHEGLPCCDDYSGNVDEIDDDEAPIVSGFNFLDDDAQTTLLPKEDDNG